MRDGKDVEGTKFDAGSCFDVEVERGGRGKVGERAEVKVRVRWWGEIEIKVGVEVGVVEWEDVEKRFRDVGVGTVGGSRVVLGGGENGPKVECMSISNANATFPARLTAL